MNALLKASLPLVLVLPACGSSKSSKDVADDISTHAELAGTWQDACHAPNPVANLLKLGFVQDKYDFDYVGKGYTRTLNGYKDNGCTQPAFLQAISGTFEVDNIGPDIDGGHPINYKVDKVIIKPQVAEAVDLFNATSFCGVKDWALNQEKLVINKQCGAQMIKNADVVFDIYRVENKQLTVGKTSLFADGSSGSTRPSERDKGLIYNKK